MNELSETNQKKLQGYQTSTVPKTCAHCTNLRVNEKLSASCGLGKFSVVPLGTCDFWTRR
jgi:hypothetical protein